MNIENLLETIELAQGLITIIKINFIIWAVFNFVYTLISYSHLYDNEIESLSGEWIKILNKLSPDAEINKSHPNTIHPGKIRSRFITEKNFEKWMAGNIVFIMIGTITNYALLVTLSNIQRTARNIGQESPVEAFYMVLGILAGWIIMILLLFYIKIVLTDKMKRNRHSIELNMNMYRAYMDGVVMHRRLYDPINQTLDKELNKDVLDEGAIEHRKKILGESLINIEIYSIAANTVTIINRGIVRYIMYHGGDIYRPLYRNALNYLFNRDGTSHIADEIDLAVNDGELDFTNNLVEILDAEQLDRIAKLRAQKIEEVVSILMGVEYR